tara:strand:+ start:1797 stop:2240 length:444 start_codon:yes stop_codon:yes gene_type:complete
MSQFIPRYFSPSSGGGGGPLKLVAFTSDNIASGLTGTLLTVTAPANQYIKLNYLLCSGVGLQSGMTLTVDGLAIFTDKLLLNSTPAESVSSNYFGVTDSWVATASSGAYRGQNTLKYIMCTSFALSKNAGNTTSIIQYAYETLEKLT